MRRPRLALLALSAASSSLLACAAEPPPPPSQPPVIQLPAPPPPPPPPSGPPPLLLVPRAEASLRPVSQVNASPVPALRAEGKRHVLHRIEEGIVVISADRGVLGVLKHPSLDTPFWGGGFGDDDAVLLAMGDTLYRAATPDDAVAGKLEALDKIDRNAIIFAAAGKIVVAAVPGVDGAYYESRDGGRHLALAKRPAKGSIVDLTVRSDGVIVAAIEKETVTNQWGGKGVRAQIFSAKRAGAWTAGPLAESFSRSVLTHHGDSIVVSALRKKPGLDHDTLGLDAKGRWIPAGYPDIWPSSVWTDSRVRIAARTERPGFPTSSDNAAGTLGMLGMAGGKCSGVDCLGRRSSLGLTPFARAFHDGVCAKENVEAHTEELSDIIAFSDSVSAAKKAPEKKRTHTRYECKKGAPAERASTLLVRAGDERHTARLPVTCASGEIVGSSRAAFVYCNAEHQGRPSILHVSPMGALTEVASNIAGDLDKLAAESTFDGTTVIVANKAAWICSAIGAPACAPVPHDHFLAARPLPAGRALVARGVSEHELQLELLGEPIAQPLRVAVSGNVLEIEVTAEGNVRLWTSPTLTRLSPPASMARSKESPPDAFLVRADGQLVPDPAAKAALLSEINAARPTPRP